MSLSTPPSQALQRNNPPSWLFANSLRNRSRSRSSSPGSDEILSGVDSQESQMKTQQQNSFSRRRTERNEASEDHEVLLDDHGEVIQEMTEEEEQLIYEVRNGPTANRSVSPSPRPNLLQRFSRPKSIVQSSTPDPKNQASNSSTSGRLLSSYLTLEKEYCQLKFEQTELVALADQRKMEKQRSSELMETLDKDLTEQRTRNAELRLTKQSLLDQLENVPQRFDTPEEQHASNHELNTLWLQRDLARHKLEETQDEMQDIREENEKLLDTLRNPPTVSDDDVNLELYRVKRMHKIVLLEKHFEELKMDLAQLRSKLAHSIGLIGKEILVDDERSEGQDVVSFRSY
jgi:hypothetical protein